MALNIVKATELPLGRRVLCLGMSGTDVKQLQSLLYQAGFYLYEIDGIYGALTMEAVILAQRAFRLKVDGIAGKIVINALQKIGDRTGRTIYTVKPGDNLNSISEKFGVTPKAWRSLTGQGNPQKKIYLGMKLLLLHKMIFLWNEVSSETFGLNATGQIRDGWQIKTGGLLEAKEELSIDNYQIVTAEAEIWQELMARSNWKELLKQAKQLKGFKIGLDLRRASLKTIWQWEKWLRDLNQVLQLEQIEFLVLPSFLNNKVDSRVFYLNFKKLSQYVKLFFLEEPLNQIDETELGVAKNRVHVIEKKFGFELAKRTVLMERVGGYDFNQTNGRWRELTFREAKIIHAVHFREAKYNSATGLTTIRYISHEEPHLMIYRNLEGWRLLMQQLAKSNLAGMTVNGLQKLGAAGIEAIKDSFAIAEYEG